MGEKTATSLSSAEMFPEIIKSRRLCRDLLYYKFSTIKYGPDQPLIGIISTDIDSESWSESTKKRSMRRLSNMISVTKKRNSLDFRLNLVN